MHTIDIDIETYSEVSLSKEGMYKYIAHESFEILLVGYSIDDGEERVEDICTTGCVSKKLLDMLQDPDYLKTAWNVAFEFNALSHFFDLQLDLTQWEDTMVKASMAGYPLQLELTAKAMKLDVEKDRRGKELIKLFSMPSKPTKRNGMRSVRTYPHQAPEKWKAYIEYNRDDVRVEKTINKQLSWFKIPHFEKEFWRLDQKINSKGVQIDVKFVDQVIALNDITHEALVRAAISITGLQNPNSLKQLKEWMMQETGDEVESFTKENVKELIKEYHMESQVKQLLEIRQQMAKSSIKKYIPMRSCAGADNRARGLFQFYGANKTGRWASRLIQLQNLVKNKMDGLHVARGLIRDGFFDELDILFDNISQVMSELCRTAFIPSKDGDELLVTDFSAIEARVLAWLAQETWRLKVFATTGKIYEASGAKIFKIPEDQVVGDIRFKAKTAELALGYQGSVGAIDRMEEMGLKTGLKDSEKKPLVDAWRQANPKIVQYWYDVEECALLAVRNPGHVYTLRNIKFGVRNNTLLIQLPSGRHLCYVKPHIKDGKFDKEVVGFYGVDQKTKRWQHQDTYGGKLVENIVQGTSRDLLAAKMKTFDDEGWDVIMHVHDELVFETPIAERTNLLKRAGEIMSQKLSWTNGLPLNAESYTCPYYIKH